MIPLVLAPKAKKMSSILLAASLLWPGGKAGAEEGAEEMFFTEIPVVVDIASLFKESDLQTGSTVEQFTPKDWNARGDRNFYDVIAHSPSTVLLDDFRGHQVYTRGLFTSSAVRGYAVSLDGIPMNLYSSQTAMYALTDFDLNLLGRVETIRGPGSSLYGSDAFHGVISLKTPDDAFDSVTLRTLYGTQKYSGASAAARKSLGGVRVFAGAGYRNLGSQDLSTRGRGVLPTSATPERKVEDGYNNATGVLKVESSGEGNVSVGAAYYYNQYKNDCSVRWTFGASALTTRPCMDNDAQTDAARVNMDVRLPGEMSLEAIGYWVMGYVDWFDNGNFLYAGFGALPAGQRLNHLISRDQKWGGRLVLKQEKGPLNTQWAVGAEQTRFVAQDFTRYRFSETTGELTNVLSGYQNNPDIRQAREVQSAFVTAKTTLAPDRFNVLWGGRYDGYSDVSGEFSPRLGLVFNPTPRTAAKLLYGHAFRAPSATEKYGAGRDAITGNVNMKPETIDTYEAVFMRQTLAWKTELVAFHSRWRNGITYKDFNPGLAVDLRYGNLNTMESNGGEWKNYLRLGNFRADTNVSYAKARTFGTATEPSDRHSTYPTWIFNVTTSYDLPVSQWKFTLVNSALVNRDENPLIIGFGTKLPVKDYWRTDLNVTKGIGQSLTLSLDVRNLFNRTNVRQDASATFMQDDPGLHGWLSLGWHFGV